MKKLVFVLLILSACGQTKVKSNTDSIYLPQVNNIGEFLSSIDYGDEGLDLGSCEIGSMSENGSGINSPSVNGPISCLVVLQPFENGVEVINLASTITVNNGIPAVIIRSIQLPESYWKRVIYHESVHAKRIPTLSIECRESADCRLNEELIAYIFQFQRLEEYWRGLGWTGGEAPVYPEGDDITFQALNFERVLWQYHQVGKLKEYLYSLGYSQ